MSEKGERLARLREEIKELKATGLKLQQENSRFAYEINCNTHLIKQQAMDIKDLQKQNAHLQEEILRHKGTIGLLEQEIKDKDSALTEFLKSLKPYIQQVQKAKTKFGKWWNAIGLAIKLVEEIIKSATVLGKDGFFDKEE